VLQQLAPPFVEASGSLTRRAAEIMALPAFEAAEGSQRTGGAVRVGLNLCNTARELQTRGEESHA
jgi:hypothetical protein